MIIRFLEDIIGTERDVCWGYGQSRRFLIERDGAGFSLTDTTVPPETECFIQYPNHVEACYCIEGEGELELENGELHPIKLGMMYCPDQHEAHTVRSGAQGIRLVCVFLPALEGREGHDLSNPENPSTY